MEHVHQSVPRPSPPPPRPQAPTPKQSTLELPPPAERGDTFIEDEVVSVIARLAAEQVPGIHRLGESSFRSLFPRWRLGRAHGVEAEVGMVEAAVDVEIIVEFGFPIREVAAELRDRVISAVETMAGRQVVEVNVYVVDVHVPREEPRHRRNLK